MNNSRYRYQEKRSHDESLEYLLHHPKVIGINEPLVWSAKQLQVFKDYPSLATDIDLLYATPSDIWIAEYKTSPGYLSTAKRQLNIGREFVKKNFNTTPRCLYVTGKDYAYMQLPKDF
jgi:hypothetical protein